MKTLRRRLLTTLLVWLALVLAVFSAVVYLQVRQNLRGDVDQYVRDKAFLLGYQVNPAYPAGILHNERPWTSDRYYGFGQTFDTNWNVLYKSSRLVDPIVPTEEVRRNAVHWLGVAYHDATGPGGERCRLATVKLEREGKFICFAQYGVFLSERDRPLRQLLLWLAGGSVAALLLAWAGLNYLIRQWGTPLAALSETARRLNLGNLQRQRLFAPPDAPELAQLAATFNELLDRLEAAHASQHRFVADASHELRTPLAALRAEIEIALRRERAPADYQRTLDSNRHELERLSSLVENLLALAALDAVPSREKSPVDLALVCRDVAEQLSPLAAAQNVRLQLELAESVTVPGDVFALERAVRNLVENAIRHTPAGEQILIRAGVDPTEVSVQVIDVGVGMTPEHLPHLFDRFYRVDTARTRLHGGAGLGLSIVKAIMEAHGGSVSVQSKLGAGSTFTLRFPRLGEPPSAASFATPR